MFLTQISVSPNLRGLNIILDISLGQEEAFDMVPRQRLPLPIVEANSDAQDVLVDLGFAFPAL